jgi:GntR family transcriptional regulator/MocR family aminotransferase
MKAGAFAAHIRRMRSRYRAARDLVAHTLVRASGGLLHVTVPDQGLHLVAALPAGLPVGVARVIRAAADIEAWLLSDTRLAGDGPDGFVLGFSGHESPALEQAAERLGEAVRRHCRAAGS